MPRECQTPFKVRYESPTDARKAAARIGGSRKRGKKVAYTPSHAYKCGCGGYHLTTQRQTRQRAVSVTRKRYENQDWEAESWSA